MVLRPLKADPTRTTHIQTQYMRDFEGRLRRLQQAIWEYIVVDDALDLYPDQRPKWITRNAGDFPTDDAKLDEFNRWFKAQVDKGILEARETAANRPGAPPPSTTPWTQKYVGSAYRKGIVRAYTDTHKERLGKPAGFYEGSKAQFLEDAFAGPERMTKVRMLGTRSYEQLKGVTGSMSARMNRILAQGIADGKHPKKLAKELRDQVGLEKSRARTIARTETIHAHSEGQLDGYEELGVEEVGIMAEWLTAGDSRVCPKCSSKSKRIYTIREARGMIPLHPNCRCCWKPVVPTKRKPLVYPDRGAYGQVKERFIGRRLAPIANARVERIRRYYEHSRN